jgi:16S rRNA (uracil1498-N3)-methyltransferase
MIRLHLPDDLGPGAEIAPAAPQAHYLLNVMRLKAGDELLLFNGRDGEWRARLAMTGKRGCRLDVEAQTRPQAASPDVELIVAVVKRARLESIVEKAAELGCARVRLVLTARTNADRAKLERLQAIATEASEQTGRLDVPEVTGPDKLGAVLDAWPEGRRLMFCDEAGDDPDAEWGGPSGRARPALEALGAVSPRATGGGDRTKSGEGRGPLHHVSRGPPPPLAGEDKWSVLIGPEGGFSPEERARLRGLPFVTPVTLGPRILRADTAAIAALTLLQAALGDWRQADP